MQKNTSPWVRDEVFALPPLFAYLECKRIASFHFHMAKIKKNTPSFDRTKCSHATYYTQSLIDTEFLRYPDRLTFVKRQMLLFSFHTAPPGTIRQTSSHRTLTLFGSLWRLYLITFPIQRIYVLRITDSCFFVKQYD